MSDKDSVVNTLTNARTDAAGKAFQSVAQSSAIAIQDAIEHLRNMNTISATTMGTAMAHMLATGDIATFSKVMDQAQSMQVNSINNFQLIAQCASKLIKDYPIE